MRDVVYRRSKRGKAVKSGDDADCVTDPVTRCSGAVVCVYNYAFVLITLIKMPIDRRIDVCTYTCGLRIHK